VHDPYGIQKITGNRIIKLYNIQFDFQLEEEDQSASLGYAFPILAEPGTANPSGSPVVYATNSSSQGELMNNALHQVSGLLTF
jgi:hypothetical protein